MTFDELTTTIRAMTNAGQLERLIETARDQQKFLAVRNARQLKCGDTIKFAANIRPTYLAGLTAIVRDFNRTSVVIECPSDIRYGRFSGSKRVRLPMNLIG